MTADTYCYSIEDRLYINLTDRCTLDCDFCPKTHDIYRVHQHDLRLGHLPDLDELLMVIPDLSDYREVVFCGFGEPTLRLKILLQLAGRIRQDQDIVIRLNTDGLGSLVNKRNIVPELAQCINAVSVSMNAQNEVVYHRHCRPAMAGSYAAMLEFLAEARRYIPEVTATAINGLEGVDIEACKAQAEQLGVGFRARELDLIG
ncbi:MAG: TatD family nuclease-associated radical SAM protein [Gammaproteobacteria bacterium]|nr:MAG: TatD family nuclease-associated radical SAM protein [Gammaproteobacteria bacterium]